MGLGNILGAVAGSANPANPILGLADTIIKRVVKDPAEQDAARLEMYKAQQQGELQDFQVQMSAIIAEANSKDPFTSRARPSFMYVMYILLLYSIPFSWIYAFSPNTAMAMVQGFGAFLTAIPKELYELFGVGFLGYVGARSYDKAKGNS